ncbi:MAG: methyltransferase domain-containing protein [Cyclobacteriaceae bacterium]|nr:methyltransferase domain-containing protein [Cyclobacteriaceae bacterium]
MIKFIGAKNLSWKYLAAYPFADQSAFRVYQEEFIKLAGSQISGSVTEIGGELKYMHYRFFPNATSFLVTNIGRDHSEYLNATDMNLADNSQDCFLCVSVLEHVHEFGKVISEIQRTLKSGGVAILTVPFMYPIHDEIDYWRFTPQSLHALFHEFAIDNFFYLGGRYSTVAVSLQRPRGKLAPRYWLFKLFGWMLLLLGRWLEEPDTYTLGFGLVVRKR